MRKSLSKILGGIFIASCWACGLAVVCWMIASWILIFQSVFGDGPVEEAPSSLCALLTFSAIIIGLACKLGQLVIAASLEYRT